MKALKFFHSILIFFTLQVAVVSKLSINSYSANMALVLIALQAMNILTGYRASHAGAIYGLLTDIFIYDFFGVNIIILFLMGIAAEKLYAYLNSKSFISLIIILVVLTFLNNLVFGLVYKILGNEFTLSYIFQRAFSWEILFNCILGLGFFALCHKLGCRRILRNGLDD